MPQIQQNQTIQNEDFYDTFLTRFADLANTGILYGTNAPHFTDLPSSVSSFYGGTTAAVSLPASGLQNDQLILASAIRNYLINSSVFYCKIRRFSVTRNVTASGGPAPDAETRTGVSHMSDANRATFTTPASSSNIQAGSTINASLLNTFIDNCYTQYTTSRASTVSASYSVCHNSCHSSCHGSRGRR